MAWFPSSKNIIEEVENYKQNSFFKKSKNLLFCFVIYCTFISIFFQEGLKLDNIALIFAVSYNLVFAFFIFLNHRWAMILFCTIYIIDKLVFIFLFDKNPIFNLIFGIVAVMLTITAFSVASKLKKIN